MKIRFAGLLSLVLLLCSCSTPQEQELKNSPFTAGNVQQNLKKGVTTQTQVLELFGTPNVTSIDGNGDEVWSYQKYATTTASSGSSGWFWLGIFGGGGQKSGYSQHQKTMTLIIKFDKTKKIKDFKSMTTDF